MKSLKLHWWAFGGGFIGAVVVLLVLHLWFLPRLTQIIHSRKFFSPSFEDLKALNEFDAYRLEMLAKKGLVVSQDAVFSATVDFYNTAMVLLVTIVSLVGIFAFLYVRATTSSEAEEVAAQAGEKSAKTYFNSREYIDDLDAALKNSDEFKALGKMDDLVERVAKLERLVSELDTTESNDADQELGEEK